MQDFPAIEFPERIVNGVSYLQVCQLRDIPQKRGKNIYFDEETQIAIFSVAGKLFAVSNICPHQHAAVLAEGLIDDLTITCPLHGWMYSLENGKALGGGARLKTYKVFCEEEKVYLEKPQPVEPKWIRDW